jgi:cellulose synthase operon protein C
MIPSLSIKRVALLIWLASLLISSAGAEENTSAHDFNAAMSALRSRDYATAIQLFDLVLTAKDDEELVRDAEFWRAESLLLSGAEADAINVYREYVKRHPQTCYTAAAYNRLGGLALKNGDAQRAAELFSASLQDSDDCTTSTMARLGLARSLLVAGRLEEVPIAIGRLANSADSDVAAEALFILGRARYDSGDFELALKTFRRIYEMDANEMVIARGRLAAGWSLWKLSRPEEVSVEIDGLKHETSCEIELRYLLGLAAYELREWGTANRELAHVANQESAHRAAAIFYLGESSLRSGDFTAARQTFQRLIDEVPESEWADDAVWGLARTARASKSKTELEKACKILQSKYPTSDYVSQISALTAGSEVDPSTSQLGFELLDEAVGLERDGHFDAAIAAYHSFVEKHQGDLRAEALWRTARLHQRLKQPSEALSFYQRMRVEFPQFDCNAELLSYMVDCEILKGDSIAAAKHREELVAKFPQTSQAAEAAYCLALAAADEQRSEDAQRHIDWLRANHSESPPRLGEQILCLQCQLWADQQQWKKIAGLLDASHSRTAVGNVAARLAYWQAEAALRVGDDLEAQKRFDELVTQCVGIAEPWVAMVSLRRAQLAGRREDWQEVLRLIEELDNRYPEFELAYECDYLRGRALAGRGEMSAARAAYVQVLENEWAAGTETVAMAQWMIGETYFHQRNYAAAAVEYARLIERYDLQEWQARAALQAGKCAELSGEWEQAIELYADALERWQGTSSQKQLTARLRWSQERVTRRAEKIVR